MTKRILLHAPLLLITLLATFYAGIQVHFPADVLQKRIQYEVQKNSKETLFLNIKETSISGIGVDFSELQVLQKDKKKDEATEVFFTPKLHAEIRHRWRVKLAAALSAAASFEGCRAFACNLDAIFGVVFNQIVQTFVHP